MSDWVEPTLRYLENFSTKRFLLLLCILLVGGSGAFIYERYTASFSLTRLEKIASLEKQLEGSTVAQDSQKELQEINHKLVEQLHALVIEGENKRIANLVTFEIPENVWLWKFLAGGVPWFLLSFTPLLNLKTKRGESILGFVSMQILVAFFAGIGAWLPTIAWPWFNLLIYPGISLLVVILPAVIPKIFAYRELKESSLRKAILNNLRMISAASSQYFLENGVSEVALQQIVGPDKYIKTLLSVSGESYAGMVIRQGQPISVTPAGGKPVTYSP